MLKFLQFFVVVLFAQSAFAQVDDNSSSAKGGGRGSSVVATVSGEPITELDVSKRIKLVTMSSGMPNNAQALKVLRPQIINMLIDEKLIAKEALKSEIEVNEHTLAAAMADLAARNNLTPAQFAEFLKQRGVEKSALEEQVKHQMLWSELVSTRIRPTIQVSNHEIEENEGFIRKARQNQKEQIEQVRLAEIVIFATEKDIQKQIQFAKKLSNDLKTGADFGKVAKEFSLASSAASGGEIGWVYVNQLAPEIYMQLEKLDKGGVTHPILLQDGIHILKIQDTRKKSNVNKEEINEEQVKEALFEQKLNLAIRAYLNKIRHNAYIKIN